MSVSLHLAVDLGASSGRVALGRLEGGKIHLEILHRFDNGPVVLGGHVHWDVPRLWQEILVGLRKAPKGVATLGVDGWGVDFALLGPDGALVGLPRHYRDPRHLEAFHNLLERVPKEVIYTETGIQVMPINTLYQLFALKEANPRLLEAAERFLMLPDLFHYWLSGSVILEWTNATTTQLVNPLTRTWSPKLLALLDLPKDLFAPPQPPGTPLAPLREELAQELGQAPIVVAPATHDTASAVAAVPAEEGEGWAYLIAGTWTLLGVEVFSPVLSEEAFRYNLTNEGGLDGTFRLLKNVMGLWLLQECRKAWNEKDFSVLARAAEEAPPFRFTLDPDAEPFLLPNEVAGPMPERITLYLEQRGQGCPNTRGEVVRTVYEALGFRYRWVLEALERVTGRPINKIYVVGGGSRDAFFCQTVADLTQRPVVAGPAEATLLGNLLVGARAVGALQAPIREVVGASIQTIRYLPRDLPGADAAYARFLNLIGRHKDERG